jgi:hypothetical protein
MPVLPRAQALRNPTDPTLYAGIERIGEVAPILNTPSNRRGNDSKVVTRKLESNDRASCAKVLTVRERGAEQSAPSRRRLQCLQYN